MSQVHRREVCLGLVAASLMPGIARAAEPAREQWLNEPKRWRREGETLFISAEPKTDFWRKTYFGYVTDNGHLLHRPVSGDFTAQVKVSGAFRDQYDQAGLMVRLSETVWLKCGVELVDKLLNVSTVFTRDYSDWSGVPLTEPHPALWIRLVRKGSAFTFSYSADGQSFREVRQGYLTDVRTVEVGLMAAAPEGGGFEARFDEYSLG